MSLQADIVAQSKIIFQEKELLQLIHAHLVNKGMLGKDCLIVKGTGDLQLIHAHLVNKGMLDKDCLIVKGTGDNLIIKLLSGLVDVFKYRTKRFIKGSV